MKTYFKFLLSLYGAALIAGGVCRVMLKLYYMDTATGFYTGGSVFALVFNAAVAAAAIIMFATNRLKTPDDDYCVDRGNLALNLLAVVTGVSAVAFAVAGSPESMLQQGYSDMFYAIREYVSIGLGCVSGFAFLYLGVSGVFGRKNTPAGLLIVIPSIWQVVLLVFRYNSFTTVVSISDHLLLVLFMIFNALFLMGMARTVCSHMRKDGRNYAIPSGLCASLCGFLLVVPNYVYMAVYKADMPVYLLGRIESVYILATSLFALFFVTALMLSIKRV